MRLPTRRFSQSVLTCVVLIGLAAQLACTECDVAADCPRAETCTAGGICRPIDDIRFDDAVEPSVIPPAEPETFSEAAVEAEPNPPPEFEGNDAGVVDLSTDAGEGDDAAPLDAGESVADAGVFDAGEPDIEPVDAGNTPIDVGPVCEVTADIGRTCPSAHVLEDIGDACVFQPDESSFDGTLSPSEEHVFIVTAHDAANQLCDVVFDSFEVVATLDAPSNVEICTATVPRFPAGNNGGPTPPESVCSLESERVCGGQTHVVIEGTKGMEDDAHTAVWVRFVPGAEPTCADYSLTVNANNR